MRSTAAALEATLDARRLPRRPRARASNRFRIERVLLHPSFGLPSLGDHPLIAARAARRSTRVARRLLPRARLDVSRFEADQSP